VASATSRSCGGRSARCFGASVLRCYGEPEYLAPEVVQKDGRSRLFWHHELEQADDRGA